MEKVETTKHFSNTNSIKIQIFKPSTQIGGILEVHKPSKTPKKKKNHAEIYHHFYGILLPEPHEFQFIWSERSDTL